MKVVVVGVNEYTQHFVRKAVELGHEVVVLDERRDVIEKLEAELDVAGAVVDPLNLDDLERLGFSRADVVVIAHKEKAVSIALSAYAKSVGIPRIMVVVDDERLAETLLRLGLASNIIIVGEVLGRTLSSLLSGAELVELSGEYVIAALNSKVFSQLIGLTLGDLEDRWGLKVLAIVNQGGELREPSSDYVIKEGDRLVVVAKGERLRELIT